MIERRTWKEFTDSKLLWWVNRSLHLFGWAIVVQGEEAYPAKTSFRGFSSDVEQEGFKVLGEKIRD